ncbi:unnamed protein product [Pylaiella littoralis]
MWTTQSRAPRGKSKGQGKRTDMPPPPPPRPPPGGYRVLVLAGIPGSGKSTLASFLEDMGWTVVNQDSLGSREKCRRRAKQILQSGGRVVIDRCNFDQSQRVTWINLAVSLSLHEDACIAVWLDVAIGVCQGRVLSRVGHPTLGPEPSSAGIVKGIAGDFRPPHRKEGFHTVLRCKDDQDLSDAVAILSYGGGRGLRPPEAKRASSAPATLESAAAGGVGGHWDGVQKAETAWDRHPINGLGVLPSAHHGLPEGFAAVAGAPPLQHPSDSIPSDVSGVATDMAVGMSGAAAAAAAAAAGRDFPVGREAISVGAAPSTLTPQAVGGTGPVLAWGQQQQQQTAVDGRRGNPHVRTRSADDKVRPAVTHDTKSYPSLPRRSCAGNSKKPQRIPSVTSKQPPQPRLPRGYRSSSLNSIAELTPQAQAAAGVSVQQPAKPQTRLLTPAEIVASFSDLQAPPKVIAPQDVGVAAASARNYLSRSVPRAATAKLEDPIANPALPLGPRTLEVWESRSAASPTCEGPETSDWSEEAVAAAAGLAHGARTSKPAAAAAAAAAEGDRENVEPTVAREDEEGLDLSVAEAFFVLEDMFGGLLPPETLEKVFLESTNSLEKAVEDAFRVCGELWGGEAGLASPASDATPADGGDTFLAPSTNTGTDSSGSDTFSETWEDESGGEFADVSEWTQKQIETLTELCLAFEGLVPREGVIAALTASGHDATAAAQLLLDPAPDSQREQGVAWEGGRRRSSRSSSSSSSRGRNGRNRERGRVAAPKQRELRTSGKLVAASLIGATCERAGGVGGRGRQSAGEGWREEDEEEEEEEKEDEGLTSEEYRTRATDAAEEMRAWFRKAAEAFTRGGRNGGAAAADPSRIGQRWKNKMEATNLRAARESFRERNPLVRVGHAHDGVSVLKVLALPAPSQCSTPGQLSVDLHLLRRAEALSVLEAVLQAVAEKKVGRNRPPAPASLTHGRDHPGAAAAGRPCVPASPADLAEPFASPPAAAAQRKAAFQEAGGRNSHSLGVQSFSSLEVVVGRGAHSVAGVPRLRPCVVGFLAGKGFRPGAVDGSRGQGVVVVGLGER